MNFAPSALAARRVVDAFITASTNNFVLAALPIQSLNINHFRSCIKTPRRLSVGSDHLHNCGPMMLENCQGSTICTRKNWFVPGAGAGPEMRCNSSAAPNQSRLSGTSQNCQFSKSSLRCTR